MIPLYKPYMPKELPELESILQSGVLNYSRWGREFETQLRSFIGNENVLTTNTYSNAIWIALATLGLKPGDEVLASPMACLVSNQPLVTYGLKVKWVDIDPLVGTLSPDAVEKAITPNTKVIYHNHFCGYVGYVESRQRRQPVLADDSCDHCHPAGHLVVCIAHCATLRFFEKGQAHQAESA